MKYILLFCLGLLVLTVRAQEIDTHYELVKMSSNVNTLYHEVSPVISVDGTVLYYFVSNHPQNTFGKENSQDIWYSTLDEKGEWSAGKRMPAPLNQNRYNQVFNALPDGSLLVRGGRGKNSKGFSMVSPGGNWTELDIPGFESMDKGLFNGATISADSKHLIMYFSEKQGDKFSDFYLSNQENGKWSKPVKMKISSTADDYSPFLAPDQKTLYFASDRFAKDKVGGTDIYKVIRKDDSWFNWSEPVNLGRSVNTPSGDAYFSIDSHGNIFTARSGARVDGGNFDLFILRPRNFNIILTGNIYEEKTRQPLQAGIEIKIKDQNPIELKSSVNGNFETRVAEINEYALTASAQGFQQFAHNYKIPRINRDTTIHVDIYLTPLAKDIFLAGIVTDKKTKQPVSNAKIIISHKADQAISYSLTAKEGRYEQPITSMGWYLFTTSYEGYLNSTDSVQVISKEITPVLKDIALTPVEVGLTVRLKHIYFDFDKTTLKSESFVELNKVVDFLKRNPTVSIEISGHTDSKGSDDYNLNLSQGRSQSVVDYIIAQGIEFSRLQAKGYGESKPVDSNDTEEGRANNRRVEVTVLKI